MAERQLTLIRKRGDCSLCDIAAETLAPIARHLNLVVSAVDLESEPGLFDRYQFDVPVVLFGDVEVARGRMVAATLEARLRDALGAQLSGRSVTPILAAPEGSGLQETSDS